MLDVSKIAESTPFQLVQSASLNGSGLRHGLEQHVNTMIVEPVSARLLPLSKCHRRNTSALFFLNDSSKRAAPPGAAIAHLAAGEKGCEL